MIATLSALLYLGIVLTQYFGLAGLLGVPFLDPRARCRRCASCAYTTGLNVFLFFSIAFLSGSLADRLQRAGARLERASSEIADLQAFNQHVIDSLASGLATTDRQGRILTFNRAAEAITGHPALSVVGRRLEEVLELPPNVADELGASLRPVARPPHRDVVSHGRRPADRARVHRDAAADTGRQRRAAVRVSGRHRHQEARARRAAAAAACGGRRDGRRHRPRNPQPARVDVGIDSDSAAGASAHRGAGAADGHRAARIGAPERHDPIVSGVREAAAVLDCAARRSPRAERRGACCCATARKCSKGTSSTCACRRPRWRSRPTRTRFGRSSGISRPTGCARCGTAAG